MKQIRVYEKEFVAINALAEKWGVKQADVIEFLLREKYGDLAEELAKQVTKILPDEPKKALSAA